MFFLQGDFESSGQVNFVRATIEGQLSCVGGKFHNQNGIALTCNGATINGGVFLRDKFESVGEVNFVGASIRGALECANSSFKNQIPDADRGRKRYEPQQDPRIALNCSAITVGAAVFLSGDYEAVGEVSFVRATIKGQLSCDGGKFRNQAGRALNCSAATIGADVFLRGDFEAIGEVSFVRATIEGQLSCDGGSFENEGRTALGLESAKIGADTFLNNSSVQGDVRFVSVDISGNLWFQNATFLGDDAIMDLRSAKIEGTVYFDRVKWAESVLDLRGARATGLSDTRPLFQTKSSKAWPFAWLTRRKMERSCWPAKGNLYLDGLTYERFVDGTRKRRVRWANWLLKFVNSFRVLPFVRRGWVARLLKTMKGWLPALQTIQVDTTFRVRREWLHLRFKDNNEKRNRFRPQPHTQCAKVLQAAGHSQDAPPHSPRSGENVDTVE